MFAYFTMPDPVPDEWPVEDIPDPEPSEWDITVPYWLDGMNRVRALCQSDVHMTTASDVGYPLPDSIIEYCIHCGTVLTEEFDEEIAGERGVDW